VPRSGRDPRRGEREGIGGYLLDARPFTLRVLLCLAACEAGSISALSIQIHGLVPSQSGTKNSNLPSTFGDVRTIAMEPAVNLNR